MDDAIGLTSALLSSGAASVVSTLWKISDTDAASFSRLFYEDFHKEAGAVDSGFVHLAKALQRAVLGILDGEKRIPPYHSAECVLHDR